MGSFSGFYDDSNEGNPEVLLIDYPLVSNDGTALDYSGFVSGGD